MGRPDLLTIILLVIAGLIVLAAIFMVGFVLYMQFKGMMRLVTVGDIVLKEALEWYKGETPSALDVGGSTTARAKQEPFEGSEFGFVDNGMGLEERTAEWGDNILLQAGERRVSVEQVIGPGAEGVEE